MEEQLEHLQVSLFHGHVEGGEPAVEPHPVHQRPHLHQHGRLPAAVLSDGQLEETGPVLYRLVHPVVGVGGPRLHRLCVEQVGKGLVAVFAGHVEAGMLLHT
jgi:hypothetical protein